MKKFTNSFNWFNCTYVISGCSNSVYPTKRMTSITTPSKQQAATLNREYMHNSRCMTVDTSTPLLERCLSGKKTVEIHANKQPLSDVMDVILNGTSSTSTFKDNTQDVNVSLKFKGSIADALNKIGPENIGYMTGNNKTNIEWGTLERRSFDVAFMPGSTAFSVGNAAEGSMINTATAMSYGMTFKERYSQEMDHCMSAKPLVKSP